MVVKYYIYNWVAYMLLGGCCQVSALHSSSSRFREKRLLWQERNLDAVFLKFRPDFNVEAGA